MDPNFSFPRRPRPPPPPGTRPSRPLVANTSPTTTTTQTSNRESNALRASVLDAALLLGVGSNSTVTNWMFNNTTQEEDEAEENDGDGEVGSFPFFSSSFTLT